jgi:hypothetical protein
MTTDCDLLEALFESVAPILAEAHASAPARGRWTVRVFPSPLHVDAVLHDRAGHEHIFRSPGTPEIAEMVAKFFNDGMAELPDPIRQSAFKAIGASNAELILVLDMEAGTAGAALMPVRDDVEPTLLFVLHRPETRH